MARIRPRTNTSGDPGTVAGRPLTAPVEPPADEAIDDLAGVEAFAPRAAGDPEDPFRRAFAEERRPHVAEGHSGLARTSLLVAVAVCIVGLLAVLLGVVDEDDEDVDVGGDDVATVATSSTTTTTTRRASTTTTTAATGPGSSTTSVPGLTPGSTATTQPRTTVTTVRRATTLPAAPTTTVLTNEPLEARIDLVGEAVAGETVLVVVTLSDPDAVPTNNCLEIVAHALGTTVLAEDACDTECPDGAPSVEATGGTRRVEIPYEVPDTATSFDVEVVGARSGDPECGNPYASVLERNATRTFPVSPAS